MFEYVIAENQPKMGKETVIQGQEVQRVPYEMNPKNNTPKHIVIKRTKIKDKENIKKQQRKSNTLCTK